MKAPILGLAVATVAFGGSSMYLWHQLDQERARSAAVEKRAADLGAQLAQLEKARSQFAERRLATPGNFPAAPVNSGSGAVPPPPPPAGDAASARPEGPVWTMRRPERSPAFQKMMRAQIRANNKRVYADVGTKLGLDTDTTNKLIDLLTDQQLPNFDAPHDANDPADWQRYQEEKRRQSLTQITDLIGADRTAALQEYQESLPARMEVDMLARQLEGYDAELTADQRKKLVDIYVEERKRVPMPESYDGMDPETYQKSVLGWQDDYNRRTAEQASRVLDSEQLTAFNEMQQWQKEMRENASFAPAGPGASPRFRRGIAGGNAVMFTTAAPVAVSASGAVAVAAPAPAPEQKKP